MLESPRSYAYTTSSRTAHRAPIEVLVAMYVCYSYILLHIVTSIFSIYILLYILVPPLYL